MLRNSFLNRYRVRITKGTEFEDNLNKQDDNYNLYENRPIGQKELKTIPNKKLNCFVEDLLTNRKSTSILYSTNANKEIRRYLHSNEVIEKNTMTQRGSRLFTNSNREGQSDAKKIKEYSFNFKQIKEHIKKYKANRMNKFIDLNKKNMIFYDKIKLQIKSRGNLVETVNSIRVTNYNRSLQRCRSFFEKKPHFKLPDVGLNIDNVFSRLFHNAIQLNNSKTEISGKKKRLFSSRSFTISNNKKEFNVKNVIESSNGKEFSMRITNSIFNKCFFKHSGGPLSRINLFKNKKNNDSNNQDQPLLSLSNMKDNDGNSYLHDAVIQNFYDFVKFYLGKKVSPNEQNIKGNTPLHYAMKKNNLKIIKLLLKNKGDVTIQNANRETPYDLASSEAKKLLR